MQAKIAFATPLSARLPLLRSATRPSLCSRRPLTYRAAMSPIDWIQNIIKASAATIAPPAKHAVLGTPIAQPKEGWEKPLEVAMFGLGW